MDFDINEMILSLTRANIEFKNIVALTIPKGTKSDRGTTNVGTCGIVFPIKGKARYTIDGKSTLLEPGVILHAGSGLDLEKEVIGNSEWKFILLHYRIFCDEKTKRYMETRNFSFQIGTDGRVELELLLQRLLKLFEEGNTINRFRCKVILYNILDTILYYVKESMVDSKSEIIKHIVDYIAENIDKNISISQLAEKAGMESKQFHYAFLKDLGTCPKKYLILSKIKRAKELLEDGSYSIGTISEMVGYEDALHFSRIFKKNTGISPSLYQKQFEKNPWDI